MLLPLFPYPFSEYLQWIAYGYDSLEESHSLKVLLKMSKNLHGYPVNVLHSLMTEETISRSFAEFQEEALEFCLFTGLPDELGIYSEDTMEILRAKEQFHLLKYAYSNTYEYYEMMKQLISYFQYTHQISVLSLGCGTFLDAWGLSEALSRSLPSCEIRYVGVDTKEHHHCLPYRKMNRGNILDFLVRDMFEDAANKKQVAPYQELFPEGAHVVTFPHSLPVFSGDNSKKSLKKLKDLGGYVLNQVGGKQFIAVCATLRQGEEEQTDLTALEQFVDGMLQAKGRHHYSIYKHFLRSTPRGRQNIRDVVDLNGRGGPLLDLPKEYPKLELLHSLCPSRGLCHEKKREQCENILCEPVERTQEPVNYKIFILQKVEPKKKGTFL